MAQGDRAQRRRERAAAAAEARSQTEQTPATAETAVTTDAPAVTGSTATSEQISAFIEGIQADIKAENFDRPAAILSEILSTGVTPVTIAPDDLKNLITTSGFAHIPGIIGQINSGLRESNPNHVDLDAQQIQNIANIADLDATAFIETMSGLVPPEGMNAFNQLAVIDGQDPVQQAQRIADAENVIAENEADPDREEGIDWWRLVSDEDYQATKGLEVLAMIDNLEKTAQSLMSSGHPMMQTLGNILLQVVGVAQPIIDNFLQVDDNTNDDVDPDLQASIDAARASQGGREEFSEAAAAPQEEAHAVVREGPVPPGGSPATITSGG